MSDGGRGLRGGGVMVGTSQGVNMQRVMRWCLGAALVLGGCDAGPGGSREPEWEIAAEGLAGALYAVNAEVGWAVGEDRGQGPAALRRHGALWLEEAVAGRGTLHAVAGGAGEAWLVGSGGRALRRAAAGQPWVAVGGASASTTLRGVVVLPGGDTWIVGDERGAGRILRWNGATLEEDVAAREAAGRAGVLWGVAGASAQDLWVVGAGGVALHRTGAGWETVPVPGGVRLVAAALVAGRMVAVGGMGQGVVVEVDADGGLADVSPMGVKELRALWGDASGRLVVVGNEGTALTRRGSVWRPLPVSPRRFDDFTGVSRDSEGTLWVAGGVTAVAPGSDGVLLKLSAAEAPW